MTSRDAKILAGSGDIRQNYNPEIAAKVKQNIINGRYPGQWIHQIEWNDHNVCLEWLYASKEDMVELTKLLRIC
jgi:hypothetical protein